jgi:ribosomal protein L12E/L44/L45/RPP1/RPP2
MSNRGFRTLIMALALAALTVTGCSPAVGQNDAAQSQDKKEESKEEVKEEKKDDKKGPLPEGKPVLWQEPADLSSRNLLLGPGGEEMKPDLKQVIWEGTEEGGYSVKWRVRDASGKKWVVKVGNEAQPETASTRLLWAAGYPVEVTYLFPCVHIVNAPKPRKEVEKCGDDEKGYANVRFEARPENVKRLDNWSWNENPFKGTNEFAGLVVMMGLLNNWDLKDTNNKVIHVPGEGGGGELRYIISDLGATFGKTGNFITHSRNEPEKYVKTGFVDKVEGGYVRFDFNGKNGGLFDAVTVEQARWIGDILSRLSDEQIKDAFRAANYKPEQVEALAQEVKERINALKSLPAPATASTPAP